MYPLPGKGSPSEEVPEVHGTSCGLVGLTATAVFLHFCLPTCLSFSSPQTLHLSLERASGVSNYSTCGWAGPHLPPSPCASFARKLVLVCGQSSAAFFAITASTIASSAVTSFPPATSMLPESPEVHSTHFQVHRWVDLLGVLVCCAEVLFFFFWLWLSNEL